MMSSELEGSFAPRVSDADREGALEMLREGVTAGRISQDTFVQRTEAVLQAQQYEQLEDAVNDLRLPYQPRAEVEPDGRLLFRMVGAVSGLPSRIRRAWRNGASAPELLLPAPAPQPLSIGRSSGSMLRLNHYTVSRNHAQMRATRQGWTLRDLGSSNGTWVNGRRVTGKVVVRPGDLVRFGDMAFRLVAPPPDDLRQLSSSR
ncbi:DUF1707 and FHA domain-containing protein [Streptomyces sp. NPDC005438]|uniref:DUF1707 and FHA domain-containing protein n=1 Tax=Streptomyces sp. NPDC005438 TaxID=3156880 RepID=UPI0033A44FB1